MPSRSMNTLRGLVGSGSQANNKADFVRASWDLASSPGWNALPDVNVLPTTQGMQSGLYSAAMVPASTISAHTHIAPPRASKDDDAHEPAIQESDDAGEDHDDQRTEDDGDDEMVSASEEDSDEPSEDDEYDDELQSSDEEEVSAEETDDQASDDEKDNDLYDSDEEASDNTPAPTRRPRVRNTCDSCRRTKVKCDQKNQPAGQSCTTCRRAVAGRPEDDNEHDGEHESSNEQEKVPQ